MNISLIYIDRYVNRCVIERWLRVQLYQKKNYRAESALFTAYYCLVTFFLLVLFMPIIDINRNE